MDMLNALNDFLQNQGAVKGLLILFAIFMVWVNWRQNKDRLADKDREIARLSADVHDMRDRMLALWDRRAPPEKQERKEE